MNLYLSNILKTAKDYNLQSNDERTLFDWLVVKQIDFGIGKPFRHSIPQVEEATLVKRKMQKYIFDKFEGMGFLKLDIEYYQNNPYRSFYVDFTKLSDPNILKHIVRQGTETYDYQMANYLELAKEQKQNSKPPTKKEIKNAKAKEEAIEAMFPKLSCQWNERVDMFNDGRLTGEKPSKARVHTTFAVTKNAKKLLGKLLEAYNEEIVLKAFMVYADRVLTHKEEDIKNYLLYFLAYEEGEFPIVSKCISIYARYEYKNS